ncbi:MAG TPA: diacylglycerol kinase family protein [Methylobacterium sp.]
MRIALVVNATAGSFDGTGTTPDRLRETLRAAGFDLPPEADPGAPLPERIRTAAALPGIAAVVVAGGDGTIACAAQVLAGGGTPLGILPLGTMNLLAKDLGIPVDFDAAIATLRAGAPRAIDVGEVNGHVFLINSVLGLPARMARHREARRGQMAPLDYLRMGLGLLRHMGRYPRLTVAGLVDGRAERLRVRTLAIVNNDYDEAPGRVLARSRVDGGDLTLYVFRTLSAARVLRLGLGFALGSWRHLPGVERRVVTELTIAARRRSLRVMNDGEVRLIASPLRYRIRPRALRVIGPTRTE